MNPPDSALRRLAAALRAEDSVVSPYVIEPVVAPLLGELAAAGPRAADAPGEFALVLESVREGHELHYGHPRVIRGADRDLELLAGDYLYALGLERLALLGELEPVRELSDLISLAAQVRDGGRTPARVERESAALWIASATAIATGASTAHEAAKAALRADSESAADALVSAATDAATGAGIANELARGADAINFPLVG